MSGKYKVIAKIGDKELIDGEGTYEVNGDKIKLKSDIPKGTETWMIKTLSESTLVVEVTNRDGKTMREFKK